MQLEIVSIPSGSVSGGTLGTLSIDGNEFCKTLEKPWLDNQPYISCVPSGDYKVKYWVSPSKGPCYYVESEDDGIVSLHGPSIRTYCLFHSGAYVWHTKGCILPGSHFISSKGELAIGNSKDTMLELIDLLGKEEHKLTIYRF